MLEVSEGVQCTPCRLIERGNFEPLSPKKNLILKTLKGLKDFDFNVEVNCRRVNNITPTPTEKMVNKRYRLGVTRFRD
ncbi:MAG: hypothetical protein LBU70_04065 [Chitinispirillales bacterium]|jgi:hypothetical protein|nr:hypothetical protein [Chitinispirillales bacterium]